MKHHYIFLCLPVLFTVLLTNEIFADNNGNAIANSSGKNASANAVSGNGNIIGNNNIIGGNNVVGNNNIVGNSNIAGDKNISGNKNIAGNNTSDTSKKRR